MKKTWDSPTEFRKERVAETLLRRVKDPPFSRELDNRKCSFGAFEQEFDEIASLLQILVQIVGHQVRGFYSIRVLLLIVNRPTWTCEDVNALVKVEEDIPLVMNGEEEDDEDMGED